MSHVGEPGAFRDLASHRTDFPAPPARRRDPDASIVDEAERARLRGRGGAGFPTSAKMRAVIEQRGRPVVLANGSEGEPTSRKDSLATSAAPHLVIDGALLSAAAVGADEIVFAVDATDVSSGRAMARALAERRRERGAPKMRVVGVPDRYVAGEERALVNFVNRGRAVPPAGDARPFEKGVGGRPTLVQNVETLAHLALLHAHGAEWFRSVGTPTFPGTLLVTLGGAVSSGAVFEVAAGTPLIELLRDGGASPGNISAVLVGGYAGTWLAPDEVATVGLDPESLSAVGGILGCASIFVLPAGACGIRETAAAMRWMADQSAGQCGPCAFGLDAIARAAASLRDGRGDQRTISRMSRWTDDVDGRGACRFPDGAVRMMRSALKVFASDASSHAKGHRCAGARRDLLLPLPDLGRAS
jgi:NADH:ubiquinone oxidoreductase subunit F (NADH-binding)